MAWQIILPPQLGAELQDQPRARRDADVPRQRERQDNGPACFIVFLAACSESVIVFTTRNSCHSSFGSRILF